jgi:putative flavoprotein involved in K+ transport
MTTETAVEPATAAVEQWLSSFDQALAAGDSAAAAELLAEESFWRDLVAFTWNIKTVEGPAGVKEMLDHTLEHVQPRNWHTSEPPAEAEGVIEATWSAPTSTYKT